MALKFFELKDQSNKITIKESSKNQSKLSNEQLVCEFFTAFKAALINYLVMSYLKLKEKKININQVYEQNDNTLRGW